MAEWSGPGKEQDPHTHRQHTAHPEGRGLQEQVCIGFHPQMKPHMLQSWLNISVSVHVCSHERHGSVGAQPGCRAGRWYNRLWLHFIWRLLCGTKIDAIFLHHYSLTRDSMPSQQWFSSCFVFFRFYPLDAPHS